MARMEFLKANTLNTTSMIVAQANNTGTVAYLFDRNQRLGFTSSGYDSTTAAVLSIVFPAPTVLSHILIQRHNLKGFRVYYDSVTANSLLVETTNSQSSTYISFSSVTVSSIDIQMDTAFSTGSEKSIGELVMTERRLQFDVNPSARNYKPATRQKRIRHEMPDGGLKLLRVANKFKANIDLEFISESFHDDLREVWDEGLPMYFVPFPTTTAWGGSGIAQAYEVLWSNDFDFTHETNDKQQGYGGRIVLEETPSA